MKKALLLLKSKFSTLSIRKKITYLTLLISIIPIAVSSSLFYSSYSSTLRTSVINSNIRFAAYIRDFVNTDFTQIENAFFQIYSEGRYGKYVLPAMAEVIETGYSANPSDFFLQQDSVRNYFNFIFNHHRNIVKVSIFNANKEQFDSWTRDLMFNRIRIDENDAKFNQVFTTSENRSFYFTYFEPTIQSQLLVFGRPIFALFPHRKIGFAYFFIEPHSLNVNYEKYKQASDEIIIVNELNEVIFHSVPEKLDLQLEEIVPESFIEAYNSPFFKQGIYLDMYITGQSLDVGHLRILTLNSLEALNRSNRDALTITIFTIILLFVVCYLFSAILARTITSPINKLCKVMEKAQTDLNVSVTEKSQSEEVSILYKSFNYMITRINDMIKVQYKLNLQTKEAQLAALQSQINPHFLCNTLQTIGGKAILNNSYEINSMCRALSDIFRYSINMPNYEATLSEEIKHVENYLFIQKIRYQDSVEYTLNMDKTFENSLILPLMLQPIIENSIVHGIEKHSNMKIHIFIDIKKLEENLEICIADTGKGIESTILTNINKRLNLGAYETEQQNSNTSIGIVNVHNRIKLYYGEKYGLEISVSKSGGTKVKITIPFRIKEPTVCLK